MMKTLKDMLIPPYDNEQICCSEVLYGIDVHILCNQ